MKNRLDNFRLKGKTVYSTMDGVQAQRTHMRNPHTVLALFAAMAIAGTVAFAQHGERVEDVAEMPTPAWSESAGIYIDVSGTFIQTAPGEGSVFIRLLDEARPLILAWHGATGFQLTPPGRLPQNTPAIATLSNPQNVAWRLRIRSLKNPVQRLVLETRQPNENWQTLFEKSMTLNGAREWMEEGGSLRVGIAGPVTLDETRVRMVRDGTLLMVK